MVFRYWIWIAIGLLAWAGLVFLWATGPHDCSPPNADHQVVCKQ